jgi:hypothetical protein
MQAGNWWEWLLAFNSNQWLGLRSHQPGTTNYADRQGLLFFFNDQGFFVQYILHVPTDNRGGGKGSKTGIGNPGLLRDVTQGKTRGNVL